MAQTCKDFLVRRQNRKLRRCLTKINTKLKQTCCFGLDFIPVLLSSLFCNSSKDFESMIQSIRGKKIFHVIHNVML